MAEAATLTMRGIAKAFGATPVLHDVDLEVRAGEFLTLVGPSGCGKSTLLRILAGLEAADAGTVSIGGRDVTGVRAADRDLAMVFQSYALYPHLSVAANMAAPLVQRELSAFGRLPVVGPLISRGARKRIAARVEEAAEILEINALLERKPGQLSGGQRQRVALGRAMVREPVAFLMDEPLSNLDAALRVHMRAELAALHRRLQRSFVYVTHDQAEALTLSDRMAVMRGGRILQLGAPDEVYNDPATLEVALFIGSPRINTLPGEIDGAGRVSRMGVPLPLRAVGGHAGPVTVAVRPEHLAVRSFASPDGLTGRLTYAENLGADVYLHLAVGDGAHVVIARAEPQVAARLSSGDDVHVEQVRGQALVFDAGGDRMALAEEAATVEAVA
ncbi:MAG: ABC transporter ATP-binding protein [Pseudomonadota bacterium]